MATESRTKNVFEKLGPIMLLSLVGLAFITGILWQKVENLQKGGVVNPGNTAGTNTGQQGPSPISVENLKAYAGDLGLNQKQFDTCLDDGKYAQAVKDDFDYGATVGVNGTPAFFVNGYLISGAQPYDVFKKTFDFLIKGGNLSAPDDTVKDLVDGNPQNGEVAKEKVAIDLGDAPSKGLSSATLSVVEFSDFECPFCGSFYSATLPSIQKDYIDTGKVKFYYKHFPLSFHANAQKAAEASECAKEQNKFWEMHDTMFSATSGV